MKRPRTTRRATAPATRVAVIGTGFGGIAAAVELARAGVRDVVILERASGVGGTWFANRYPGAETDAASHVYSYSFAPYDWSRTHVRQGELQAYLEHVVNRFGLRAQIRFGRAVESVVWDEVRAEHEVTTTDAEVLRVDAVVCAVGIFSSPRVLDLPGLSGPSGFRGTVLHTASWDPAASLTGKRVAVLGTGSSATQVVPAIAGDAAHVTVFQRQPGWVLPKGDRDYTPVERRLYRLPGLWKLDRLRWYLRQERREFRGAFFRPGTRANTRAREAGLAHIARVFAGRPDLAAVLTPAYDFGGKRAVLSSRFYESLLREDVSLVPHAVTAATPTGVVDATGVHHEVDAVVMATGFHVADYLPGLRVVGRDGAELHDVWKGDASALLGLVVPGFPNFFIMYGPGTNGGFIVSNLQRQARFAAREIARLSPRRPATEVRPRAAERYDSWLQRMISRTAFAATDNYFQSPTGRVVTQWPDSATLYALLTVVLRRVVMRRSPAPRGTQPPRHRG